jgi:hypothetical protein
MLLSSKHRSSRNSAGSALSVLLAFCLGWTLALMHASEQSRRDSERERSTPIGAQLNLGEPAPRPVADVSTAQAKLSALLQVRARSAQQQPVAAPAWLAALLLPLRLRSLSQLSAVKVQRSKAPRRVVMYSWPLPRSSCSHTDDDVDEQRRSS